LKLETEADILALR